MDGWMDVLSPGSPSHPLPRHTSPDQFCEDFELGWGVLFSDLPTL